MKNISKPEHLVLVNELDLADYLEWLLPEAELYNLILLKALDQFWLAGYKAQDVTASMSDLNESMFAQIFRLRQAFDIIIAKKNELIRE